LKSVKIELKLYRKLEPQQQTTNKEELKRLLGQVHFLLRDHIQNTGGRDQGTPAGSLLLQTELSILHYFHVELHFREVSFASTSEFPH
jgi:hypothetical protein